MAPSTSVPRTKRLAATITRELGRLLNQDVNDPRTEGATITEVRLSGDLQFAKVFFVVHGDEQRREEAEAGLRNVRGFLQRELGKRLRARHTPLLRFHYDDRFDYAESIENVLSEIADPEDPTADNG